MIPALVLFWRGHTKAEGPVSVDWTLSKKEKCFEYEALIRVKDVGGAPVNGVRIEIDVDIPSMPMMHKLPRATASPGDQPGTYHAKFMVEMAGRWTAKIEVWEPARASVVKRFEAE